MGPNSGTSSHIAAVLVTIDLRVGRLSIHVLSSLSHRPFCATTVIFNFLFYFAKLKAYFSTMKTYAYITRSLVYIVYVSFQETLPSKKLFYKATSCEQYWKMAGCDSITDLIQRRNHIITYCKKSHLIWQIQNLFNPFLTNVPLLYPLKTSENLRFPGV